MPRAARCALHGRRYRATTAVLTMKSRGCRRPSEHVVRKDSDPEKPHAEAPSPVAWLQVPPALLPRPASTPGDPRRDQIRRLQMSSVAGAKDNFDARIGDRRGHPLRDRVELLVALADNERYRHAQLLQSIPQ